MFGKADDDAFARLIRNDVAGRNEDLNALARQPWINAGIGGDDLFVTDAITPTDIKQRVFMPSDGVLNLANDVVRSSGQRIRRSVRKRRRQRSDQAKCTQEIRSKSFVHIVK